MSDKHEDILFMITSFTSSGRGSTKTGGSLFVCPERQSAGEFLPRFNRDLRARKYPEAFSRKEEKP